MQLKPNEMQLPQYIIDFVGALYDEGLDDESICTAVLAEIAKQENHPCFPNTLAM